MNGGEGGSLWDRTGGQGFLLCHSGAPDQLGRPHLWPPEGFVKDAMMHNSRKLFSMYFLTNMNNLNMNIGKVLRMKLLGQHVYRILRLYGCILLNCMPGRLHHVRSYEWSGVWFMQKSWLLVVRPLFPLAQPLHSTFFSVPRWVICVSAIGFYVFKPFTFIVMTYIYFFIWSLLQKATCKVKPLSMLICFVANALYWILALGFVSVSYWTMYGFSFKIFLSLHFSQKFQKPASCVVNIMWFLNQKAPYI